MNTSTLHLLVVDDSPTVRKLVEITFRSTAWRVDFAANGAEAIEIASTQGPRVILLDVVLPDIPAVDVCAELALHPRTRDTPIILMSAKDETVRRSFSRYPAVVDFIQKPFTRDELSSCLLAAAGRVRGVAPERSEADGMSTLSGRWPATEICSLLGSSARSGELVFHNARSSICVFWQRGEIVFVTSFDPADHTDWAGCELDAVDPDRLRAAERVQRESGKPLVITLAEEGQLPPSCDVAVLLREVGRRLLREILMTKEQSFDWRELASLPPYVSAYGRQMPISKSEVLPNETAELSPQVIFEHSPQLEINIDSVELTVRERRVLALVDGRMTLQTVAACAGLDIDYVGHIARSLLAAGLVIQQQERRTSPVVPLFGRSKEM